MAVSSRLEECSDTVGSILIIAVQVVGFSRVAEAIVAVVVLGSSVSWLLDAVVVLVLRDVAPFGLGAYIGY
jgi:hypothetical protein